MSPDEQVRVRLEDGRPPVVVLRGEVDLNLDSSLRVCLGDALAMGAQDICLDLEEVSFIDSHTIGILAATLKRQQDHGGRLVVLKASSVVRKVFDITGLSQLVLMPSDIEITAVLPGQDGCQ